MAKKQEFQEREITVHYLGPDGFPRTKKVVDPGYYYLTKRRQHSQLRPQSIKERKSGAPYVRRIIKHDYLDYIKQPVQTPRNRR